MNANNVPAAPYVSRESSATARATQSWGVFSTWLVTRVIILYLAIGPERHADSDIRHYWKQMAPMFHGRSARGVLVEYPLPVLSFLWPLDQVVGGQPRAFNILFALTMLIVDGGFSLFLFRRGRRFNDSSGVWFWLCFGLFLGPILIFRFDVVCGVLAALALTWSVSRPIRSGGALALASAVKLWPIALVPILLVQRKGQRNLLLGASLTGGIVLLICVITEGTKRTVSPLTWQNERGLQIESVFASLAVIQRAYDPNTWKATFQFGAVEISGPGVGMAEKASSLTLLISAMAVALFLLRYRRTLSYTTLSWVYLLTIAVLIVTNKTYSAQYIMWLAAPCAIFLPQVSHARLRQQIICLVLSITVLTQLEYPILYGHLWPQSTSWDVVIVLVTRNALAVVLTAVFARQAVRSAEEAVVNRPTC